jgi:hypothetical protein
MEVDMKELAAELARCGNALLALSAAMTGAKPTAQPKPAAPTEPVPLEKVRSVLADKSRLGHTAEVKALLQKHGAQKLSEIDPAEYPILLAEAEALR